MGVNNPNERPPTRSKRRAVELAALLMSGTEHKPAPPIPPAPKTYSRGLPRHPTALGRILSSTHGYDRLVEGTPSESQMRGIKRDDYANAHFPYTNALQVAFANAAGDISRNVLTRAALVSGGVAPSVHPGPAENPDAGSNAAEPKRVAGYAYRGEDNIWLTPDAYAYADPNFARGVALHEFGHTRQRSRPAPNWQIEGGADWLAQRLAETVGVPDYRPGYPQYEGRYRRLPSRRAFNTALLR